MNDEQEVILRGLMVGLDARYRQMNAKLLDAVARLERSRWANNQWCGSLERELCNGKRYQTILVGEQTVPLHQ